MLGCCPLLFFRIEDLNVHDCYASSLLPLLLPLSAPLPLPLLLPLLRIRFRRRRRREPVLSCSSLKHSLATLFR
jgi:hypothetical protein